MVICLERSADLHTAQLMPLPLTVSCFSEIQIGFTFLVPAHPGSPGQRAVKRVCVCVYTFFDASCWSFLNHSRYLVVPFILFIHQFFHSFHESLIPLSSTVTFHDAPFIQFNPVISCLSLTSCFVIRNISF